MANIPAVHFGPGRLGLGLIVDVLYGTDAYDVYLIGAPGRPQRERGEYTIRFTDPERGLVERRVLWAGNPQSITDLPEQLLDALRSGDQPVLVTAALGDKAVEEAKSRIAAVLGLRPAGARTALLACENEPHTMYDDLEGDFPDVDVRRCVVDRICAWDERAPDDPIRRVLAHDVGEWVIPHAANPALDGLRSCEKVVLLEGSALAYKHRNSGSSTASTSCWRLSHDARVSTSFP